MPWVCKTGCHKDPKVSFAVIQNEHRMTTVAHYYSPDDKDLESDTRPPEELKCSTTLEWGEPRCFMCGFAVKWVDEDLANFNPTLTQWLNDAGMVSGDWPDNVPDNIKKKAEAFIGQGKLDEDGWPVKE